MRYYIALAEELHFRKAAERLNLAQPALTRQLQELESKLGVVLIRRDRRNVELTPAGTVLLERARRVVAEAEYAVVATKQTANRLSIGFIPSTSYVLVPTILKAFRESTRAVALDLQSLVTAPQVDALMRRRLDVGIVRPWPRPSSLRYKPLASEDFVVAVPAGHPLAGRVGVSLSEFADERFMLLPSHADSSSSSLSELNMKIFRRAGFDPEVTQETPSDLHTALGMVNVGLGVAMVPRSMMHFRIDGIAFTQVQEAAKDSEVGIAWHKENDANPLCIQFIEMAASASALIDATKA